MAEHSPRSCLLAIPLLVLGYTSSVAQERPPRERRATWVTLGLGLGPQFGTEVAVAGVGAISHQRGVLILSLTGVSASSGIISAKAVGILAGVGTPPKTRHASAQLGIARVSGDHASRAVVGVPVQVQVGVSTRALGIAVLGYANVNSYHTFGAAAIALQVGSLW